MKKSLLILFVLALGLAWTGSAMAQMGQLDKMKNKAKEAAEGMTFEGEVTAVDEEAKTFTVKGEAKEMTFLAKEGKVRLDGGAKALTDLKTGTNVTVTFVSKDDKHTAMDVKSKD
jgi:hypothetical protein